MQGKNKVCHWFSRYTQLRCVARVYHCTMGTIQDGRHLTRANKIPANIKPTLNQSFVLAGGEYKPSKMSILEGWTSSWGIDHKKLILLKSKFHMSYNLYNKYNSKMVCVANSTTHAQHHCVSSSAAWMPGLIPANRRR